MLGGLCLAVAGSLTGAFLPAPPTVLTVKSAPTPLVEVGPLVPATIPTQAASEVLQDASVSQAEATAETRAPQNAQIRKKHAAARPAKALPRQPIDLNRATAVQLQQLPGVGPKMALRILELRKQLGGRFQTVEQLLDVKGIGEKKMEKLRPYVRVSGAG